MATTALAITYFEEDLKDATPHICTPAVLDISKTFRGLAQPSVGTQILSFAS